MSLRRTDRDFQDRTISQNLSQEMARSFDVSLDTLEEIVRDHARELENSINGVVAVESGPKVVCVRVIYGKDADGDAIQIMVQDTMSKVMRAADDARDS